jgi:hypothetical protein
MSKRFVTTKEFAEACAHFASFKQEWEDFIDYLTEQAQDAAGRFAITPSDEVARLTYCGFNHVLGQIAVVKPLMEAAAEREAIPGEYGPSGAAHDIDEPPGK